MRFKDILTEEEDKKIQELKMDLLDAPNERVRTLILDEIDEIFETARHRYYSTIGNKEQAATVEKLVKKTMNKRSLSIVFRAKKEHVLH